MLCEGADGQLNTSAYVGGISADTTDTVTATPIVSHQHAQAPGLAVNGDTLEVVYADQGPLPVWIDSGQSLNATPLCSGDDGAGGAAGAGGAP
jgi:hypothetical protein